MIAPGNTFLFPFLRWATLFVFPLGMGNIFYFGTERDNELRVCPGQQKLPMPLNVSRCKDSHMKICFKFINHVKNIDSVRVTKQGYILQTIQQNQTDEQYKTRREGTEGLTVQNQMLVSLKTGAGSSKLENLYFLWTEGWILFDRLVCKHSVTVP